MRCTSIKIKNLKSYKISGTNTVFAIFVPVFCNIYLSTANLIYFFVQFFVHVRGRMLTVSGETIRFQIPSPLQLNVCRTTQ